MNKLTFTTLLAGLVAVSAAAPAFADHRHWDDDDEDGDSRTVYAKVVSAVPVYRQVRVSAPRRECRDERVVYRGHDGDNTAGAILGGIIGGVAGHQIGGGRGRDVATAVGAVLGANIGRQSGRGYGDDERVGYEPRCETVDSYRYEERVDGYDVTYRYRGGLYTTRMPYDPGRRMPVHVDVQPVRYSD